jgi:hypothetical protein
MERKQSCSGVPWFLAADGRCSHAKAGVRHCGRGKQHLIARLSRNEFRGVFVVTDTREPT